MKKTIALILALALIFLFASCARREQGIRMTADGLYILTVGATPVPHAQLLNLIRDDMAAQGVYLEIVEFSDFTQPNRALIDGDLDANYFQHTPFLQANDEWYSRLTPAFGVHIEPFGLYSLRHDSIDDLPNNAQIAIPNDPTNGGRALLLLEAHGLITLREGAGIRATLRDIVDNPRNFRFHELEAPQLPRSLQDVDAATINGNFAMQAGFNPVEDSLIIEGRYSPYVNIVAVHRGQEEDHRIIALKNALLSDRIREHIINTFRGGVVPIF